MANEIKRRYGVSYWSEEHGKWFFAGWFDTRIESSEVTRQFRDYRVVEEVTTVIENTFDQLKQLQDKILRCTNMEELREQLDLIDWEMED